MQVARSDGGVNSIEHDWNAGGAEESAFVRLLKGRRAVKMRQKLRKYKYVNI